jgi:DNA-binding transcriptional regulator YiaG
MPDSADMTPGLSRPDLLRVLESAARLQAVVPDAVLVGGSAAALWASHRTLFDHDHVLADLDAHGRGDDPMSALKFRNITASVDDPVETWPFEGILAAVERGTLPDWRRLAAAVRADPWGPVAQQVLEAVEMSRPRGTSELLTTVIERARQDAADAEREQVASEIRDLVVRSGLSKQDFALRLGTSRPRLSTYISGKVTPSAALMLRMRRVAAQAEARNGRQLPDRD